MTRNHLLCRCPLMLGLFCVSGTAVLLQLGFQKAAAPSGVKLPVGEWSGEGQYAYETWPKQPAADAPAAISTTSRYPTRLSIRAEKLEGRDVLMFDILSKHKEVGVLKDDVHAVLAFEEVKRLSDTVLLYRLVAHEMNPSEGEALHYENSAPQASGSLFREGGDLVFSVQYDENNSETYLFSGAASGRIGDVRKIGLIAAERGDEEERSRENVSGFIHWVETLKKK